MRQRQKVQEVLREIGWGRKYKVESYKVKFDSGRVIFERLCQSGINMYERPYTKEQILKYYPDKADGLLNDPAHLWRAETGIELIHKEPTREEQERIWKNWNEMTEEMKRISDEKSRELFGMDNASHYDFISGDWIKI